MVRTQVQLTEEQAAALKKIAAIQHVSMAQLVRKAVDALIKSGTFRDAEERCKRAVAAAGRFRSGLHDLSSEHDKYLTKAFGK